MNLPVLTPQAPQVSTRPLVANADNVQCVRKGAHFHVNAQCTNCEKTSCAIQTLPLPFGFVWGVVEFRCTSHTCGSNPEMHRISSRECHGA